MSEERDRECRVHHSYIFSEKGEFILFVVKSMTAPKSFKEESNLMFVEQFDLGTEGTAQPFSKVYVLSGPAFYVQQKQLGILKV